MSGGRAGADLRPAKNRFPSREAQFRTGRLKERTVVGARVGPALPAGPVAQWPGAPGARARAPAQAPLAQGAPIPGRRRDRHRGGATAGRNIRARRTVANGVTDHARALVRRGRAFQPKV